MKQRNKFSIMDYMAITGGLINLIVVGVIVGYWFLN